MLDWFDTKTKIIFHDRRGGHLKQNKINNLSVNIFSMVTFMYELILKVLKFSKTKKRIIFFNDYAILIPFQWLTIFFFFFWKQSPDDICAKLCSGIRVWKDFAEIFIYLLHFESNPQQQILYLNTRDIVAAAKLPANDCKQLQQ